MRASAPPPSPAGKQPRNPISRKQVEAVISRSIAGFGIVFGVQTIPVLLGQLGETAPVWLIIVVPALFGGLLVAAGFSTARRWVRGSHALVALAYLGALLSWPLAVVHPISPTENHWLYFLLTVATATASIAFPTRIATAYLFAVPVIYGILRVTPEGGGAPWERSALDAVYAIILGGAVMIIVTMLRQAASSVDSAQATALERYSHAVRQHATEVERVQVDAIVHDSVLTTLLSAARAYTPESQALAAQMAERAIGHLRDAASTSPDDITMTSFTRVTERIADAAATMTQPFEVHDDQVPHRVVPAPVGESLYSAAVQAMVNSAQHAGDGVRRWVAVRPDADDGIAIEVGDEGRGFDLAAVPTERLGVRVSILERVANAGGVAEIDAQPGRGAVVSIRWPAVDAQEPAGIGGRA